MRALPLLVLLLCGCRTNRDVLEARFADAEHQLAKAQATAEKMIEDRKALAAAEQELSSALAQEPAARVSVELEQEPAPAPVLPTFPPLPPESLFEGERGARLRRYIQEMELRITQFAKINAEAERINARLRHVQRQLELARSHRK